MQESQELRNIDDPVLGRLTWDQIYGSWTWSFAVALPDGSTVRAYALRQLGWDPLSDEATSWIRALIGWLRENEPALRLRVAAEMFEEWRSDFWDADADGTATPERLAALMRLAEVTLVPGRLAYLEYHSEPAGGPAAIRLGLDWNGQVVLKPTYPW